MSRAPPSSLVPSSFSANSLQTSAPHSHGFSLRQSQQHAVEGPHSSIIATPHVPPHNPSPHQNSPPSPTPSRHRAPAGNSKGSRNSCEVFGVEGAESSEAQHEGRIESLQTGEKHEIIGGLSENTFLDLAGSLTAIRQEQTCHVRGMSLPRAEQLDAVHSAYNGTSSAAKRGHFSNANHLLNFQYDPIHRPRRRAPAPAPRRQHRPQPYNKEHFLQANFRFLVSDFGDYSLNSTDPDKMLQWEDIAAVNVSAPEEIQCPICLESPPLCPQITFCGHIFCFPCILRYLLIGEEHGGALPKKCPLCFAMVSCKELRTVYVDNVHNYQVGDVANFTLLTRARNSVIPFERGEPFTGLLPYSKDGQCHRFAKFTLTSDADQILNKSITELSTWADINKNGSEDIDLLPYVYAAMDQLEQRKVAWQEHRAAEFLSSSPPVRQRIVAQTKAGLKKVSAEGTSEIHAGSLIVESIKRSVQSKQKAGPNVAAETEAAMSLLKDKAGWVYETPFSDDEDSNRMQKHKDEKDKLDGKASILGDRREIFNDALEATSSSADLVEDAGNLRKSKGIADLEKKNEDADDRDSYSFYQMVDGQSMILHPLNMKCLLEHYGSYSMLPTRIQGKIVEMETITQTEATRKRYRYLGHLPLTTNFQLCEVDLKRVLPSAAMAPFMDDLLVRENRRNRLLKQQQHERAMQEQAAMASISKSKPPSPSEFLSAVAKADSEVPSNLDFKDSISEAPAQVIRTPLDEEKLFSRVTRLGFASAHDAPALSSSRTSTGPHVQSESSTLSKNPQDDNSHATMNRMSALSFADVIQAQPSRVTQSDSSGVNKIKQSSSKRERKKVLLTTAGGRRY